MAINPINRQSTLRLMGISSGMDTEAIIQNTLRVRQMKIDSQFRSRTVLEWKQQMLNGISDDLNSFRRTYLTTMGDKAMRLSSTYNTTVATVSGKNKEAVSVATTINSPVGTLRIGQVHSLAQAANVQSSSSVSRDGKGFKLTDKLGDIRVTGNQIDLTNLYIQPLTINGKNIDLFISDDASDLQNQLFNSGVFGAGISYGQTGLTSMLINGVPFTLSEYDSPTDLLDKLNAAGIKGLPQNPADPPVPLPQNSGDPPVTLEISSLTGKTFKVTMEYGDTSADLVRKANSPFTFGAHGEGSVVSAVDINVNGKNITLTDTDTAVNLVRKYNEASTGNSKVTGAILWDANGNKNIRINNTSITINKDMTIDEMLAKVNSSGSGATMRYDQAGDRFVIERNQPGYSSLNVWGLDMFGITDGTVSNGSLALVEINGKVEQFNSNTFDYRGMKITLNYTTRGSGPLDASGQPTWSDEDNINITLKRDATDAIDKIKSFVEEYNALVKKLEDLIKESKTRTERTYTPLTDEEKEGMTDKQIEEWEKIAKKGLLRNDSAIQGVLNSLRGALFEKVTNAGLTPADIGVSTGNYFDGTGGQIVLDIEKLTAALEKDPEQVSKVFMDSGDSYSEKGLMFRMDDIMYNYIYGSQSSAINQLSTSIRRANEQMESLQQKMYDEEERLYKKFAAMETAMSKLQSQGDWLNSMLTSMNGSNK